MGNAITIVSSLAIFLLLSRNNEELTYAKLFSTLEMLSCLKYYVFSATIAIGSYYEVRVIFERYANIFNLKNKSMIKVDQPNKDFSQGN